MNNAIILRSLSLDHPSVQSVLKIAEDILSKNKVLDLESLYNIAKKTLKIPRKGLLYIIQFLLNRKILIEGSKFSKETVLSNQYRYNIYSFIKNQRGVHFSFIKKNVFTDNKCTLGSSGQLIWHLEMLLKFEYIKKLKVGNYTVFIPIEIDEDLGALYFLLKDDINKKIIKLLYEKESIIKSDIYKLLNEKRENVYYRINNLIEYDLISLNKESTNNISLNPEQKEIIAVILRSNKIN